MCKEDMKTIAAFIIKVLSNPGNGEIQSQVARDIEYTILPGYLPFLMNARNFDAFPVYGTCL